MFLDDSPTFDQHYPRKGWFEDFSIEWRVTKLAIAGLDPAFRPNAIGLVEALLYRYLSKSRTLPR